MDQSTPDNGPLPDQNSEPQPENSPSPRDEARGWQAFELLGNFLREDGWYPQPLEGKPIYAVGFNGKNGGQRCYAQIRLELEQFLFYAVSPIKAPEEVRPAVAEFLTRANYGLRIGNFELDFQDGEVRYKSSLDFQGETLTPNLMRNAIYPAVNTLDHYLVGLMSVMFGGRTPVEAIQEIEGEGESG